MMALLALTFPPLQEVLLALLLIALVGALFTVLAPYVAEPFRKIILIVAAFVLVGWVLHLFGVI